MTFEQMLVERTAGFYELSGDELSTLAAHFHLLQKWNRHLNLTSVIDPEGAARKHYAESLYVACQLPPGIRQVADIGSGAGFPGFPLAAVRPDITVTLVESDVRKAAFLHECRDLLPNLRVANVRSGALSSGIFDALVTRAVNLSELEPLIPFVAPFALAITSCAGSTWNVIANLPWDEKSCIVSRGTDKL